MKNFRIFKYIYGGMLMIAVALIGGCKDNIGYDVTGDAINRVYINTQSEYVNTFNLSVLHTPLSSTGNIAASFPVQCTQNAAADLKVTLTVDTTLISAYNKANSTNYSKIPDGLLVLSNNVLTIPKGTMNSNDSLSIAIPSIDDGELTSAGYLVPIKISTISSIDNTVISSNLNTVYLVIGTSWTNCYSSPALTDMVGTLVSTRTTWNATLNIPLSYGALSNLFDNNTKTYWYVSPAQKCALTVDMSAVYANITGIRISSYSTSYGLTQMNIYSSNDGVNWVSQGMATLSTASSYQYIKFYSAISARYLKLEIVGWHSSSYVIMSEFSIYTGS
jgi:hypothetical protein